MNPFEYDFQAFFEELPEIPLQRNVGYRRNKEELTSRMLGCKFIQWCRQYSERVSEPLWYAMISNLITIRPGGVDLCHQFSSGYPGYSSGETNRKILHALNSSRPHTCNFINSQGFDCKRDCGVKSPSALTYKSIPNSYGGLPNGNGKKRIKVSLGKRN